MANDCTKIVGVKNIMMTFRNCETQQIIGPVSHQLAREELPKWRLFEFKQEKLPGGYVRRHHISPECEIVLIRNLGIPLKDYQGRSAIKVQVEYENGLVYTGESGGVQGEDMSDTHEVSMKIAFHDLEELLPPGALMQP